MIIDTEGNPTDDDFKDLATNCDLLVISAVPESVRNGRSDSHARKEMSCGQTHFLLRLRIKGPLGRAHCLLSKFF